MGNRISISFSNKNEESVALFSHWGGRGLLNRALRYLRNLKQSEIPTDVLEPSVLMVDFIRELTKDAEPLHIDFYLGKDGNDGDNSDNGHFTIDVETEELK